MTEIIVSVTAAAAGRDGEAAAPVAINSTKRIFDASSALVLIVFFAPLLLAIALMVVASSKGPAVFRQRCYGLNGRAFTLYTFRTVRMMEDDSEMSQACKADDRLTAVGRLLRRTGLDELAKLFNVLKGEMSMVGPRPHAIANDARFAAVASDFRGRYRAKPGITGLAEVKGCRGAGALAARTRHDLAYIRDWSLALDLKIALNALSRLFYDPHAC